jgi:hypothetical protein
VNRDDPDVAYEYWLRAPKNPNSQAIPSDVRDWLLGLAGERWDTWDLCAAQCGVSDRRLYAARRGSAMSLAIGTALARELDVLEEFDLRVCEVGREGWSEHGTYCGEGSGALDGCGTFHHQHYADGLCVDCWVREVLGVEGEPRDVRMVNAG